MNLLFIYIQSFTKLIFKPCSIKNSPEPKIRFSALEEQDRNRVSTSTGLLTRIQLTLVQPDPIPYR